MTGFHKPTRRLSRLRTVASMVLWALLLQSCSVGSALRSEVYVQDVEWLADGSRYFIREQGFDGLLVDLKTGVSRQLVDSVRIFDVAYSPDGKQIVYIDTDKKVQTVHID